MFNVRVRNFQSIRDAHVEVSGFTVVTGSNNAGKSALVRAIRGAFTNPRGHAYVRHGAEAARVDLSFSDGQTLTWEKGPRDNRYTLNGKILEKVGAGVPPEVSRLRVEPLEAAGREIWPQFAPQFTGQVFLLDEPGSVLAEAVADVSRVGVLNEALRLAQSDRRTVALEIKAAASEVARGEGELARYGGLDALSARVVKLEEAAERIRTGGERRAALIRLRDRLREAAAAVAFYGRARSVRVPAAPPRLAAGVEGVERVRYLTRQLSAGRRVLAALAAARGVIIPPGAVGAGLERGALEVEAVREMRARLIESSLGAAGASQIRARALGVLVGDPPPALPRDLSRWAVAAPLGVRARAARSALEKAREEAKGAAAAHRSAALSVEALRAELGSCPWCGTAAPPPNHRHENP